MTDVKLEEKHSVCSARESRHIKEEPEAFPFLVATVKTEDDEDESSVLRQGPSEENGEETTAAAEAGHEQRLKTEDSGAESDWSWEWEAPLRQSRRKTASTMEPRPEDQTRPETRAGPRPGFPTVRPALPHIKQEPEVFPFHVVTVKTEDDEDEPSVLHQSSPEKNREETNTMDFGAEADSEDTDSEDTDCSEDYSQEWSEPKRSYAMILPDSCVMGPSTPFSSSEDRPFTCSVCGKSYSRNTNLQKHIATIHRGEKPHKCPDCERRFTSKYCLKSHMFVHTGVRPLKCLICEQGFSRRHSLTKHQQAVHHMCPVCKKQFPDEEKLNEHLSRTEVGILNTKSRKEKKRELMRPFSCSYCGKRYRCKSSLQSHVTAHTGVRPHRCSVCDKTFSLKGNLTKHMTVHTGEKTVRCTVCDKAFQTDYQLKSHMGTHTGQRPFKCSVCEKGFTQRNYLKGHMKFHSEEKPYKCSVCGNGFKTASSLKTHRKTHTKD